MNKRKLLCILLSLAMVLSTAMQGFVFSASAESNATSLLLGDANLDDKVNVKDATNIQKAVAKIISFGDIATETADVDDNGNINVKDATAVQKWVANIDVPYLIGQLFEYISEIIEGGFILLNVNPEVRIGFNPDGNVTTVTAVNEDAEVLIKDFTGYQGKDCTEVVEMLIALIKDAGYLVDEIDGENKVVVIQLEAGSKEPREGFMDELKACAKHKVKDLDAKPEFVKIEGKDYDEKYASGDEASPFINLEKAVEIALAYSGVWAEDAVFEEKEYEIHRGTPYYELEFAANGFEFEVTVNALNGKVVKFEKEKCDHHYDSSFDEVKPDRPQRPHRPASADEFITLDEAKAIALNDAGASIDEAKFKERHLDLEDGTPYYELEFIANGFEYEYEIHAVTGEIIDSECEPLEEDDDRHHNSGKNDDNEDCQKPSTPLPTEPEESKPEKETKPVPSEPEEEKPEFTKPTITEPEEKPEFTKPSKDFIDIEDAKDEAINHAGIDKDKVKFDKTELDEEDGKHRFEIEFEDDEYEYEYEVDAESGEIINHEKDKKDRR